MISRLGGGPSPKNDSLWRERGLCLTREPECWHRDRLWVVPNPAELHRPFPKWESPKNRFSKRGKFSANAIVVSKNQRAYTYHHKFTTKKPRFAAHVFQKTPAKTRKHQQIKKCMIPASPGANPKDGAGGNPQRVLRLNHVSIPHPCVRVLHIDETPGERARQHQVEPAPDAQGRPVSR
jgi:hypothetical protein